MDDTHWEEAWHTLGGILGSKWSCHVLRLLSADSHRFNELDREIDGMTATMLSRRLKELRCHGLVDRTVGDGSPPETRYRLTDAGREFARLLGEMEDLVEIHEVTPDTACEERCEEETDTNCVSSNGDDTCLRISS